MQTQQFEELLLQTAFCCMISDGNIDEKAIADFTKLNIEEVKL